MKRVMSGLRGGRGQSVVEMALVVPMFILLFMGVIDLGRAFHDYVVLSNAVREGARYGSRYSWHTAGIVDAVHVEAANNGIDPSTIAVTVTFPSGWACMQPIRVTGIYAFDTVLGALVGVSTVPLGSSTEMSVFARCAAGCGDDCLP
jgi:Flp pilus assembly protein TadG